ncbi:copper resistance protein NlpE [Zophobihabitans entericus]|uniref:Type IV secretion system putative lipoprotein virB7 n=1 Tax=Zophobihabitans entericus TaxID=1635327 RepID=A0A6G9IDN6_9GAMM|nr:copper resistance protein NlpE N-terminal domain-containing protein [Zophobihabitans entericus]QIQ22348.1 copper resistance protein NlpE [Zophobihabitans entericus]
MKKYLLVLLAVFTLAACQGQSDTVAKVQDGVDKLGYVGVYKGYLPAADVSGIKVTLTLDAEGHYNYLASYDNGKLIDAGNVVKSGDYTWDKATNTITLSNFSGAPNKYLVGEGTLTQLDMEGKVITGDFANMYVFKKY